MKYIAAISVFILFATSAVAQKDVKWTEPQPHPCFYGLKISVVNMGFLVYYNWGIKITNNYRKAVTFKYKLLVGGKGSNYYSVAFNLKPGETHTEGTSHFNSISFENNPSTNWSVAITEVCFEGNTCGGKEECYADCDRIQGNENQPCDNNKPKKEPALMNGIASSPDDQKTSKGYTGAFTEWRQEGKDVKLTIGQNENGIYWKKNANEPPVLFKNIRQGTYRYEVGTDFFIIRFESDNRISFWNNGSLLGYFTKPEEKKNETVKKEEPKKPTVSENKVSSAGNEPTTIEGVYWPSGTAFSPLEVKIINGGVSIKAVYDYAPASAWLRISTNEYQSQSNPVNKIKVINSNTLRQGITTYSKASLWSKTEKWLNNDAANTYDYLMLYIDNDGLHEMYSRLRNNECCENLSYFAQKISTDTYKRSENPDYPNYRAVIYKMTSPTTLTIEYTDTNGQVNATKFYTKASK